MPKKKTIEVVEANEPEIVAEAEVETPVPSLTIEPASVSTPALPDRVVRVRNEGKPFPCDLTAYGYGMRWPTNAVYSIPASKYMELLQQGLDGVSA